MRHALPRCAFWLLALLTLPLPALASSLLIWPIYPTIESHQTASALWLENQGDNAVVMQLRVFEWQQREGEDQYYPQQAITGSPPMMEIAPGERQLVRLIRQVPTPSAQEQAFRVIIDEIPATTSDDSNEASHSASVRLQMRYSLPLFSYGEGAAPAARHASNDLPYPGLSWRVIPQEGESWLEIHNSAEQHVRLSQVAFQQGGQRSEVASGLLGYVLPGSTRRWPLPQDARPTDRLVANIQGVEHVIASATD